MSNEIELIKQHGLFVTTLSNGEWMVASASRIYRVDINSNNYTDDNLSIAPVLKDAISNWVKVHVRTNDDKKNKRRT